MPVLTPPSPRSDTRTAVRVRAPGRLHLGFLDPSGTLGRRFGSLGLVVDGFETELELVLADRDEWAAAGAAAEAELPRVAEHLQRLRAHTGHRQPLALRLHRVLPAHAGFGSGTQLALAVGRAFARCHGLEVGTAQLAQWLGRGLRSGIGIAGFDQGGLLLDGGPRADGAPAALLSRLPLPEPWRVLVALDPRVHGLSGADERAAIARLAPLPQAAAAEICHQVLMRVLPGAAGAEFEPFAAGLDRVQRILGGHFAPAQGGSAWTSPAVARLMGWIHEAAPGGCAVGQSSWGPTGFALLPSAAAAATLVEAAHAAGAADPGLELHVVGGRNRGAQVGA